MNPRGTQGQEHWDLIVGNPEHPLLVKRLVAFQTAWQGRVPTTPRTLKEKQPIESLRRVHIIKKR